jgi:hypothetical protein
MDLVAVVSSNLAAVSYNPLTAEMHVLFHTGWLYSYSNVTPEEHAGLMAATSKGQYLSYVIRRRHWGTRIG